MELRRLLFAGILVAAAVTLTDALVTRTGVGPLEYVTGVAIVAALVVVAFRVLRRGIRRA